MKRLVVLLSCLFAVGCSTLSHHTVESSIREQWDQKFVLINEGGLTPRGCTHLFLEEGTGCISTWSALAPMGRLEHLRAKGNSIVRGLVQDELSPIVITALMKGSGGRLSINEVRAHFESSREVLLRDCLGATMGRREEDSCIFFFARIATDEEIRTALLHERDVLEADRRRQLLLRSRSFGPSYTGATNPMSGFRHRFPPMKR